MAPGAPGAGIKYTCSKEEGAVLAIKPYAIREDLRPSKIIKDYVLRNYEHWYDHAEGNLGLDLDRTKGQIIFVTGCDKTAEWDAFAWISDSGQVSLTLRGGAPAAASGALSIGRKWEMSSSIQHRSFPVAMDLSYLQGGLSSTSAGTPVGAQDAPSANNRFNQCVFVRGYKVQKKLRIWPQVIKAGAGPHQLPPSPPPDGREDIPGDQARVGAPNAHFSAMELESTPTVNPVR